MKDFVKSRSEMLEMIASNQGEKRIYQTSGLN